MTDRQGVDRDVNGQTDGQTDKTVGQTDRQMRHGTDRHKAFRRMDRETNEWAVEQTISKTYRRMNSGTDRQMDGRMDSQKEACQLNIQMFGRWDRQTDGQGYEIDIRKLLVI